MITLINQHIGYRFFLLSELFFELSSSLLIEVINNLSHDLYNVLLQYISRVNGFIFKYIMYFEMAADSIMVII